MRIIVLIKLVPDLVEELSIDDNGKQLDTTWMRMIINEFDDHALEQAILLKEKYSAEVIALAPDLEGIDEVLFTAYSKGVDRAIKITGDLNSFNNHGLGRSIASIIRNLEPDLILTGVQANNDLDGSIGPILASLLNQPFTGYVSGITIEDGTAKVFKEYPGGVKAELQITLPAVIGIQASEQPPRYVAVSKIRQFMKTSSIEDMPISEFDQSGSPNVVRFFLPEKSTAAEMISGDPEMVADRMINIFKEKGIL